ncbi:MAG: hypothetical protein AAB317_04750 [Nitrospirota bacterium]
MILILNRFLLLIFGFLTLLALFNPATFIASMEEDRWAEWATFYAFFTAFGFAIIGFIQSPKNDWKKKGCDPCEGSGGVQIRLLIPNLMFLGLALFCLLVALEEISWGQRLFAYKPPDLFLEKNYQQELNFHNFLKNKAWVLGPIRIVLDPKYLAAYIAIIYGVLFPLITFYLARWEKGLGWISTLAPTMTFIPLFTFVAWVELTYPIKFSGEAAELLLGLLFLSDLLLRIQPIALLPARLYPAFPVIVIGFVFLFGIATTWSIDFFRFGYNPDAITQTKNELDLIRKDLLSGSVIQPSLFESSGFHKRIFTAVESGYLRFGNRHSYFLDPWNNSYWISYQEGRIIIYSMGPNRRRDVSFHDLTLEAFTSGGFDGDDIVMGFPFP